MYKLPNSRAQASSNWRDKHEDLITRPAASTYTSKPSSPPASTPGPVRKSKGTHPPVGTPTTPPHHPTYPSNTRLYLGNLLYSLQPQVIQNFLTDNGYSQSEVTMSIDPFSGRNPSYCFVDFPTAEIASCALAKLNGMEIRGRPVNIKPGVPKRDEASTSSQRPDVRVVNWSWGKQGNAGKLSSSTNAELIPIKTTRWSPYAPAPRLGQSSLYKRLFVGGFPRIDNQAAQEEAVREVFRGFSLEAVSKQISPHPSKCSKPGNHYYFFVDFGSKEEAEEAVMAVDGTMMWWGGKVSVNFAKAGGESKRLLREQYPESNVKAMEVAFASWK